MTDNPAFIFFLDMDGVINNPRVSLSFPPKKVHQMYGWIDPVSVNFLNRWADYIEDQHGDEVEIVLSTTWRGPHKNWSTAEMMLSAQGVEPRVHKNFKTRNTGMTIDGVKDIRGFQIRDWLNENPSHTNWMLIDDSSDFTDEQKLRHVHTDVEDGILSRHHFAAIEIIDKIYKGDI